jgi:hypothetical protein
MNTTASAAIEDDVDLLEAAFGARCGHLCSVDCLAQRPRCLSDGMCGYRFETSCFPDFYPDAAVDASVDAS